MNFNFFFHSPSSISGTCADWAMVVITLVSAGALIWTLLEQMGINKEQQRIINQQNSEKARREIRPCFKIKHEKYKGNGRLLMNISFF
ncbi:hypothetical protein [Albibacterium sp.]|uniref:hypothetical protein n=1 Tax=Albibacterium sp. TaxID=2952885 RepID=UPI002C078E03|nr:hypothetical protein [Albibacterium sp.]HUH19556.1 hypothetical protein [Albibacterium sp.]